MLLTGTPGVNVRLEQSSVRVARAPKCFGRGCGAAALRASTACGGLDSMIHTKASPGPRSCRARRGNWPSHAGPDVSAGSGYVATERISLGFNRYGTRVPCDRCHPGGIRTEKLLGSSRYVGQWGVDGFASMR